MNPQEIKLTMEQEFGVLAFNTQVDQMSLEQAREMLKLVNRTLVVTQACMLSMLKDNLPAGHYGQSNPRQPGREGEQQ